jgi:hypothetical protein
MSCRQLNARANDATVVNLGTAIGYTILAKTAISTVPQSQIEGNIGVSPASSTSITGFDPLVLSNDGTFGTLAYLLVHVASCTPL